MTRLPRTLFLSALLVLSGLPVYAQTAAEQPDTLVLSDTLTYNDARRESVFSGNVIMTRGNMKLLADQLVVREDDDGFQYATATVKPGAQVLIEQENPEKFELLQARGLRGEYDGKTQQVVVIGKATITRFICGKPFDTIKGERVTYHQRSETYEAVGGPQSAASDGRVRSLSRPRASAEAAIAECRKKAGQ